MRLAQLRSHEQRSDYPSPLGRQEIEGPAGGSGVHGFHPYALGVQMLQAAGMGKAEVLAAAENNQLRLQLGELLKMCWQQTLKSGASPGCAPGLGRDVNIAGEFFAVDAHPPRTVARDAGSAGCIWQ